MSTTQDTPSGADQPSIKAVLMTDDEAIQVYRGAVLAYQQDDDVILVAHENHEDDLRDVAREVNLDGL